jgi:RNA polymerase sigma-70 factor (ECF subfamily)
MNETPHELIARARAGEEEAFRMLVEQHSRSVYAVAYRILGDPADAEEAVQETFLRVFRRLDQFEGQARFGTWLYRVAANAALDLVRKRQRSAGREATIDTVEGHDRVFVAATAGPERHARDAEIEQRVLAAMRRLTPGERAAFTLRHIEGLSIREICEALDLQTNAVKNAIFRAVQKMRQELSPLAREMS